MACDNKSCKCKNCDCDKCSCDGRKLCTCTPESTSCCCKKNN